MNSKYPPNKPKEDFYSTFNTRKFNTNVNNSPRPNFLVPGSSRLVVEENDNELNNCGADEYDLEAYSTGNLTGRPKTAKHSV